MRKEKNGKRLIVMVTAAILGMTLLTGGALVYAQQATKNAVLHDEMQAMADQETQKLQDYWNGFYKDNPYVSEDIMKQMCVKFELDYDTVKTKDVTRQMSNYVDALQMKEEQRTDSMEPLESWVTDIFAFSEGSSEPIIREICEQAGLDYETATIDDLSVDQLTEILERAYETSDHPKE